MPGLAERIRERREAIGLTQLDLAQALGCDRMEINHYECDRRTPSADKLVGLVRNLACSADYLLGIIDDPRPWGDRPPPALGSAQKAKRPAKPSKPGKKAIGLPGAGKSLEQAQAEAVAQGRRYVEHEGRAYRLRKDGWEPV